MSKSLDRLTLLSTFQRIAERGSISAAARDLGLSQASASRQLAELEERLGVQLIQRTTHSLTLTDTGEDCLLEARSLLEGWESLLERYAAEDEMVSGKLKVIAPVALGQLELADAALSFQATYPKVDIVWILQDEPTRFAETGCDLLIRVGPIPDETLIVREIGKIERLLVCSPSLVKAARVRSPEDLKDLPCAALGPYEGGRISVSDREGNTEVISANVVLSTNNIFSAKKAAVKKIGYAIMPRWFVEPELSKGVLVDLLPDWRAASLTVKIAYLPARRQTRRLRLFISHIEDAVANMKGIQRVQASS